MSSACLVSPHTHTHNFPVLCTHLYPEDAKECMYCLCRPQWKTLTKPTSQVQAFVDHIEATAVAQPHLLAAHSYAMHSALLAGGQLIKRMLSWHMQLDQGKGTAVFDYQASDLGNFLDILVKAMQCICFSTRSPLVQSCQSWCKDAAVSCCHKLATMLSLLQCHCRNL